MTRSKQNASAMAPAEHQLLSGFVAQLLAKLQQSPDTSANVDMLETAARARRWLARHPPTAPLPARPCKDPSCGSVFQPMNARALYCTPQCRFRHNKRESRALSKHTARKRAAS